MWAISLLFIPERMVVPGGRDRLVLSSACGLVNGCAYETQLVNDSLRMAIWKHKPHKSLLWHTDRGSQYASENHRYLLKQHGIQQSMSQKGNCWDNAVSESFFFHTLKTELIHHQTFHARQKAKQVVC